MTINFNRILAIATHVIMEVPVKLDLQIKVFVAFAHLLSKE